MTSPPSPATDLSRILAALSEGARVLRIHHIHWAADALEAHTEALSSQEAVKATTERN